MSENQNQYKFDAVDLILYFWNKRIPIIIVGFATAIISAVVSLCITEKYKSEVILFPTASGSISQDLLSTASVGKSLLRLGEDEELDQLMQVLQSDQIRQSIIDKFDLMNHYEIKSGTKYPLTQLYQKYSKNIVIKPTKFLSAQITVWDTDPKVAADIANEISNLVDTVMNGMQHEKAMQALALVEKEYNDLLSDINKREDSLNYLRSLGVVDYLTQVETLTDALGVALSKGNTSAANEIQKRIDHLGEVGGPYLSITEQLVYDKKQLVDLKSKYAEAKVDATQQLAHKYVVNKATVAEKKSYPVRWLIVVTSTLSVVILFMLCLIIKDSVAKRIEYIKK